MAPPPNIDQLLAQIQFPGMPRPESEVFREWLTRHGREYDAIDFNVRLGDGAKVPEGLSETTQKLATLLSQKRADVVAWQGQQPTIFEVKVRANPGALGQLLAYRTLWPSKYPHSPEPLLAVLARRVDDDSLAVFGAHGVDVILYEDL